jgi:hypothetical protein
MDRSDRSGVIPGLGFGPQAWKSIITGRAYGFRARR